MNAVKKYILIAALAALTITLWGCTESQKSQAPQKDKKLKQQGDLQSENKVEKYIDSGKNPETIVDSAIELSHKYSKLLEESAELKQENKQLKQTTATQKDKIQKLQTQLDKTQQELQQANDLLVEMKIELNNWKADILGFREEMKDAQQAQLEALYKILTILGAQPTESNNPNKPTEKQDS